MFFLRHFVCKFAEVGIDIYASLQRCAVFHKRILSNTKIVKKEGARDGK